jgi:hypothetical protein
MQLVAVDVTLDVLPVVCAVVFAFSSPAKIAFASSLCVPALPSIDATTTFDFLA